MLCRHLYTWTHTLYLSQHERSVHPAEYQASLARGHQTGNKRRWTYEEKVLVARAEVELSGCESLNARLCLAFPERTFEAIKGLRRNPAYRALVNELRSEGDRRMPEPAATLPPRWMPL